MANMSGAHHPLTRARRNLTFAKTNREKAIEKHIADMEARALHIAELEARIIELKQEQEQA